MKSWQSPGLEVPADRIWLRQEDMAAFTVTVIQASGVLTGQSAQRLRVDMSALSVDAFGKLAHRVLPYVKHPGRTFFGTIHEEKSTEKKPAITATRAKVTVPTAKLG